MVWRMRGGREREETLETENGLRASKLLELEASAAMETEISSRKERRDSPCGERGRRLKRRTFHLGKNSAGQGIQDAAGVRVPVTV